MIFGQAPPPVEEDPVYNQPCLSVCKLAFPADPAAEPLACPKTDTDRTARLSAEAKKKTVG